VGTEKEEEEEPRRWVEEVRTTTPSQAAEEELVPRLKSAADGDLQFCSRRGQGGRDVYRAEALARRRCWRVRQEARLTAVGRDWRAT